MKYGQMFEIVYSQKFSLVRQLFVLRDKQTGVQYLFVYDGAAGGLTPLLDADGKPVTDKQDK